jgi:predicted TIM-barrel fold metal-dependent hydrolase
MTDIKKIDVHAHCVLFPEYTPKYRENGCTIPNAETMFDFYEKLNIEMGVLLPIISPEAQLCVLPAENSKYLADKYPDRFLWFCNVDPRSFTNSKDSELGYLLEHYKSLGAKGVGELTSNLYADDPRMDNLFSYCEELDMPVTIHIAPEAQGYYGIVDELGLPRIEKMLKKHPKLKIFGHSQPFWSEIGDNNTNEVRNKYVKGKVQNGRLPELLRKYENLYCDLSAGSGANAMMRDRDHAAAFIEEFSDRIMYGCDICMHNQKFPFEFDEFLTSMRETGEISEENYVKLVRGNACRLLGLQ